jgi:hypothetical protein
VLAVLACLGPQQPLDALEADPYYAWARPLADATDAVNAKFNLELERAILSFEHAPPECEDIAVRFRKRMRFILFHKIQIWAMNTSLVQRVPEDGNEYFDYRRSSMYRFHGPLDTGMWMPLTPIIEVNGVRISTDKLSHLVSSGWTYYSTRQKALRRGMSEDEAERAAVRRGILEERLILGAAVDGILSIADMEANLQGMQLYVDLCAGDDPVIANEQGLWSIRRPIDLRDYVHPGWDESYRVSIFRDGRWEKIEPGLQQYCALRDDPWVLDMQNRYRARDRATAVQSEVEKLVDQGRLPDPARFTLDAACGAADGASHQARERPPTPADAPPSGDPAAAIIAEENTAEHRTVPIAALRLSYPQIASLSYGVLLTRLPAAYDCRVPCDMWGGFAQIEPGIGGGKASVGWGRVIGEQRRGRPYLAGVFLAMAGKATVLRTWGEESPLPASQTYAGAEFEFSVARVNMGLGALRRVAGDEGRDWVVTGHLGWGF